MIKRYFIMAIAAAFALVACTKNFDEPGMEIQPAGSENVHTLSVGIEAGAYVPVDGQTKASTEAVIRVKWEEGDKISVVNASTGEILGGYLKADETGESVTFSGTVTGTIEPTDQLYYVYPRIVDNAEAVDFDEAGYDISLANQTYNGSDISKVSFYGYAEDKVSSNTISKKIKFNLVTSYAHLNMAGLPAKGADLNTLDVSNVNEGFTWTLNGSWLKVEPYAGSNSISVSCTNTKITQAGNAVVRFAIPASAATEQARVLTVNKAYKNDGYVKAELKSSSYYNQLYTIWVSSNVEVEDKGDKKEVTIDNEGSTEKAEGILPVADAFGNKPTEIGIGGVGTITFDATASAKIKENADDANSTNVFFKVEDVTETKPVENVNLVYEVTMKTVDGNGVEVFSESKAAGVATVTVPLGEDVQDVTSVKLVNDSGVEIEGGVVPESVHFENGILSFQVNHFSKYAIKYTSKETPGSYVAQIGSRKYTTLANAIAAVQNGNTIEMLANVTDANGISVPKNKKFTVDFGGYTYTGLDNPAGSTGTTNQVFQLLQGSTITFKNGTINVATTNSSKFRFIIQNYANLTLEDIILDGTNLAITDRDRYTISNNCGTVEFKGATTIKAAAERGIAFDVCKYQSYEAPTVTWNSTGTVNGGIELSGGKFVVAKNLSVSVPVMAAEGESTLEIGTGATLSSASDFNDPNPNLTNHKSTAPVQVKQGAGLTICGDGTVEGINNAYSAVIVSINGDNDSKTAKLTVNGNVTLKGNYYGVVGNGNRHNTEITVNGGTIKGTYTNDNLGIFHPQAGKLTITGGTIEGYSSAVEVRGGTVNITGGSLKSTATTFSCTKNGSGNTTVGAALAIAQHNTRKPIDVTIDGGTFTGYKAISVEDPEDGDPQNVNVTINGGTFSDESAIKYAAKNAAINIVLNSNRDASGIFIKADENKTITFDLGGKTLNFVGPAVGSTGTENQAFHIEKGNGTFTLKNGKVTIDQSAKDKFRFIIQNYNNLVVEDVELDGTNLAVNTGKVNYTVSNNSGNVEFNGTTTIKAAAENGIAFDVCKSGSYAEPIVTWNSTGDVVGGIELSGGKFILGHNLEVSRPIRVIAPAELDIASYTLSATSGFSNKPRGVVIVNRGGDLTIKGTTGVIEGSTNGVYAAVAMTEPEPCDKDINKDKPAKLTVNGGTLQGLYYGIVGNGTRNNTEITVNGGTITGTCNTEENGNGGIYHPQEGKLTITGGIITGLDYAVEVRSGTEVIISGGTFTSTASKYSCVKNGSGSTTVGAALAIAQHTTKHPINVSISGGTFTGPRAVALEDIEGNKDGDNVNVSISGGTYTATEYAVFNNYAGTSINISDGKFESTGANGIAVYARLGSVNITGGEFINNSNSEATLHVGCPEAVTKELQPKLTISGNQLPVGGGSTAAKTIVKNLAEGKYSYNSDLNPLVVNMANELGYKAVTIVNGWFYGQKPEKDDSYTGTDASNPKWFLGENCTASWEGDHWVIGLSGTPGTPIYGD